MARDPFFSFNMREQASVTTPPQTIRVLPLPTKNRPANFSGLVGLVEIEIEPPAVAENAKLGDSVTLNAKLTTNGDLGGDLKLDWPADKAFKLYPDQPEDQLFLNNSQDRPSLLHQRTLKSAIVPLETGPLTVGPLVIGYFDPQTKSYQWARSNSVAINIGSGSGPTANSTLPGQNFGRGSGSRRLSSDILPNHLGEITRVNHSLRFSLIWLLAIVLPALAALLFWRLRQDDSHKQRRRRVSRAGKRALEKLQQANKQGVSAEEVHRIYSDFLRERFTLPSGVIDAEQLAQLSNSVTLVQQLEKIETLRYGAGDGSLQKENIVGETSEVIREVG
jgi:hypothetical protein